MRPTAAASLVLLAAATAFSDPLPRHGFILPTTAPTTRRSSSRTFSGLLPPRTATVAAPDPNKCQRQRRVCGPSSLRMMGGAVEAVSPLLLGQLAGCAALVGVGKVLLKQEEEEGIEPAAPWAEGLERSGEVDLYRDTWVRYFGYANEVGEAFRPVVPVLLVTLSYAVAFAYILADSYSQGAKVKDPDSGSWRVPSVLAGIDSLLFQIMASVVFPSFTINRSVACVGALLQELPTTTGSDPLPEWVQYVPTAVGLVIIPAICPALDVLTHRLLDGSFRSASAGILRGREGEEERA